MGNCCSSVANREIQQSVQNTVPGPEARPVLPGQVCDLQSQVDPRQPSVTISWQPPHNHTAVNIVIYTVRFKPDDSDEYKYVATLPPSHGRICAPLTVEDGLEPLTTFTFQVRAESAVPYSAPDSGWSAGIQKYIDWHCRYPSCCNSRLKLDVPSSPHVVHAACGGDMVRGSARPPIYDFCRKDHKTIFDAKYCVYPECTKLTSLSGGAESDSIDVLVSTRNHFCGQEHWNGAVKKDHSYFVSVDPTSKQYNFARKRFERSWAKKKGVCPTVQGVLAVINPSIEEQLRVYRDSLPGRYKKTEMYFHGTRMDCLLNEFHVMCDEEKCGVCGIAKKGFQQKCISDRWQRFGRAFYLAPNSSKSHDYCVIRSRTSTTPSSSYQGMFLCEVAAGKKHSLRRNSVFLQGPPDGCHSVYGKSKFMFLKGDLNYDEIVIFNEKAICPRFVILYQ